MSAPVEPQRVAAPLALPVDSDTLRRLHGRACWHCGGTVGALLHLGFVYTLSDGGCLGWPVVAHETHQAKAAA